LIAALRAAIPPSGSPPACPVGSRSDSFGARLLGLRPDFFAAENYY